MNHGQVTIKFVSPTQPEISNLISSLDNYQKELYAEESNHLISIEELCQPDCKVLAAYVNKEAVGVAACKFNDGYAEIKRFYVDPTYRGAGVATRILEEIEKLIRLADNPLARLETGIHQTEALQFYKKNGFKERKAFEPYKEDPLSIFMEKIIL